MMRSERVKENVELSGDWTSEKDLNWIRFFYLLVITGPVGFFALRFLLRLIMSWSRNGLNLFEAGFILFGFAMVFRFYRWAIQKVI